MFPCRVTAYTRPQDAGKLRRSCASKFSILRCCGNASGASAKAWSCPTAPTWAPRAPRSPRAIRSIEALLPQVQTAVNRAMAKDATAARGRRRAGAAAAGRGWLRRAKIAIRAEPLIVDETVAAVAGAEPGRRRHLHRRRAPPRPPPARRHPAGVRGLRRDGRAGAGRDRRGDRARMARHRDRHPPPHRRAGGRRDRGRDHRGVGAPRAGVRGLPRRHRSPEGAGARSGRRRSAPAAKPGSASAPSAHRAAGAQPARTRADNGRMRTEARRSAALDAIIGDDPALRAVLARAALVAPTATPVLVTGESGTGKELVARALHELGPNPRGPFVAVNCGALPRELAESELFGHERGAFTGAAARRAGWFEEASGGTLVLDEIGELPLDLQPKLLRVLETGRLRRVGGAGEVAVRVRVVAMTLRDLAGRGQPARVPRRSLLPAGRVLRCACRRCASAAATSRCWRRTSCARSRGEVGRAAARRGGAGGADDGDLARQRARAAQRHPARGDPDRGQRGDGRIDVDALELPPPPRVPARRGRATGPRRPAPRRPRAARCRTTRSGSRGPHVRRDRARDLRLGAAPQRRQPAARRARPRASRAPRSATR